MSKLEERENRRKSSVVASLVGADEQATTPARRRGRPKSQQETRHRTCISVMPSVYEDFQKIAYVKRVSASSILEMLMRSYIAKNEDVLAEYGELTIPPDYNI